MKKFLYIFVCIGAMWLILLIMWFWVYVLGSIPVIGFILNLPFTFEGLAINFVFLIIDKITGFNFLEICLIAKFAIREMDGVVRVYTPGLAFVINLFFFGILGPILAPFAILNKDEDQGSIRNL